MEKKYIIIFRIEKQTRPIVVKLNVKCKYPLLPKKTQIRSNTINILPNCYRKRSHPLRQKQSSHLREELQMQRQSGKVNMKRERKDNPHSQA